MAQQGHLRQLRHTSWKAGGMDGPTTKKFPNITAMPWLAAKQVLGGEATDFTPWLQQESSLELLGQALKLQDLTLVEAESNVLGKRLDILARALDENGDEVPVCIENQYGMSDADHLGRLIAYLAQQERGRAVWVVEQAHEAFVAGVRFLNRTSTEEAGYYLVQVRFAPSATAGYHVHFEVLAAPIAWERAGRRGAGGARPVNKSKVVYLNQMLDAVKPALLAAGFPSMNTHARGSYLWVTWPADLWFKSYSNRLDIRVTKTTAIVAVYVTAFDSKVANTAAAQVLRDRLSADLADALPEGTVQNWEAAATGRRKVIRFELVGQGWVTGDADTASGWAAETCTAVVEVLRSNPVDDLDAIVKEQYPGTSVGDPDDEADLDED